jgi:hypothetical protein
MKLYSWGMILSDQSQVEDKNMQGKWMSMGQNCQANLRYSQTRIKNDLNVQLCTSVARYCQAHLK